MLWHTLDRSSPLLRIELPREDSRKLKKLFEQRNATAANRGGANPLTNSLEVSTLHSDTESRFRLKSVPLLPVSTMATPSRVRLLALPRKPFAEMFVIASLDPLLVVKMIPGTMEACGVNPRPFTATLRRISPSRPGERSALS